MRKDHMLMDASPGEQLAVGRVCSADRRPVHGVVTRRAKDLAGQLRLVYAEMPERADLFRDLVRKVSRDEVEVVD